MGNNAAGLYALTDEHEAIREAVRDIAEREIAPYLFGGVQILSPSLFAEAPEGPFSLNILYDRAIEAERLYGLVHDGAWFHLSTPRDLDRAETMLRAGMLTALF